MSLRVACALMVFGVLAIEAGAVIGGAPLYHLLIANGIISAYIGLMGALWKVMV